MPLAAVHDPLVAGAQAAAQLGLGASGSSAVKIFLVLTALSFGSAILISITCFTRLIIVLSFLRQALGTPQLPPNQVLLGLSLFLTLFIMGPVASRVHGEALSRAERPVGDWMLRQTREDDLRLFFEISGRTLPRRGDPIPFTVLAPAFMVSELSTAFRMGLFLFIPMLLIDLLVAAILMSLGMMMVPPTLIALPLKLGVFLLAGGWNLVVSSLVRSFS